MKKSNGILLACLLFFFIIAISSCSVVAGAFKFTFWMGALFVILIVLIILWIMNKAKK